MLDNVPWHMLNYVLNVATKSKLFHSFVQKLGRCNLSKCQSWLFASFFGTPYSLSRYSYLLFNKFAQWSESSYRYPSSIHNRYPVLAYTTQVNSALHAHRLVILEVISKALFTSEKPKRNKMALRVALGTKSNVLVR